MCNVLPRAYKSGNVAAVAEVEELLHSALGPKTLCCPGTPNSMKLLFGFRIFLP